MIPVNFARARKTSLAVAVSLALGLGPAAVSHAATLAQNATYNVKILVWDDPASRDLCSAFNFGDISATSCLNGGASAFVDNSQPGPPALSGGDGIAGDGLAGSFTITTAKASSTGTINFSLDTFQVDPYLQTAGGTFKTTMTPPDGSIGAQAGGTVDAGGNMLLDVTGRAGVAATFVNSLGILPWNINNSNAVQGNGDPVTGLYEPFTTGISSNFDPTNGGINISLSGRPIGDANNDGILDAVLVSVSNVGAPWGAFDGTPYSEAFNVQFELLAADPVAVADSLGASSAAGALITISTDLLGNDSIATNEALTLAAFDAATTAGGGVVDNGNDTLTYTPPNPAFTGQDTFTYTIADTNNDTDTATVTLTVTAAANNPPVAVDDTAVTDEDVVVPVIDVTANDTDADTDPLTVTAFDNPSAQGGTVANNGDNTLRYTPAPNFSGADSFTYTISDGRGGNATATVNITVNSVNDPLVCTDVQATTAVDSALTLDAGATLLSTCTDVESTTFTLTGVGQPTQPGSTASFDGSNTVIYTPAPGLTGSDSFTYTASDGTATDTRTVNVSVGQVFGNFTMMDAADGAGCSTFGGTNDIIASWDGTFNTSSSDTNFNMSMVSEVDFPFNGFPWFAHNIRVFGPGTYTVDTTCSTAQLEAGLGADCGGDPATQFLSFTINPGQIGAHILFDWNQERNIDVINVWDHDAAFIAPAGIEIWKGERAPAGVFADDAIFELASRDVEGDGCPGRRILAGNFTGFRPNFNLNFTTSGAGGGGGVVAADPSSIGSPDLGDTAGCSIASGQPRVARHGEWLLLAGFIAAAGLRGRQRRNSRS